MSEIMTAEEARKKADDAGTEVSREARAALSVKIESAVLKGETEAWVYGTHKMLLKAKEIAETLGYETVFHSEQRDGPVLKLKW